LYIDHSNISFTYNSENVRKKYLNSYKIQEGLLFIYLYINNIFLNYKKNKYIIYLLHIYCQSILLQRFIT